MLRIEMLPAGHGDALLVEYRRDGETGPPKRILIDGGAWYSYPQVRERLLRSASPEGVLELELLVVTHVDSDHADGIIRLLHDPAVEVRAEDVWFNGWKHLQPQALGTLAGQQGEYLDALLDARGLPWNRRFGGKPVTADGAAGSTIVLEGGLKLTVLSPYREHLEVLRTEWEAAVRTAGLIPGDRERALAQLERRARYRPPVLGGTDDSKANASSIALLAEIDGRRILLAGDAWPAVLRRSLDALPAGDRRVDLFKLSHHGSFGSLSADLVEMLAPRSYLVSTNGSYYSHPDAPAVELILARHPAGAPHLAFNYESDETRDWLAPQTQERRGYTASLEAGRMIEAMPAPR